MDRDQVDERSFFFTMDKDRVPDIGANISFLRIESIFFSCWLAEE